MACLWTLEAGAQGSVVAASSALPLLPFAQQAAGNDIIVNMYMQLESLQREVQDLRGVVEEQSYQIRRMQEEQRDRYLDLDRRMSGISSGQGAMPDPFANTAPVPGFGEPIPAFPGNEAPINEPATFGFGDAVGGNQTGPGLTSPPPLSGASADPGGMPQIAATPENEGQIYRTALNLLLESSQFDQSASMFRQYIDAYPNGQYLTNAYYWLGEALILLSRYNDARDAFMKLINDYPGDPKTPGAYLKLGVVYNRMGDTGLARQVWQDLPIRYPDNADEIRAARDFLSRN